LSSFLKLTWLYIPGPDRGIDVCRSAVLKKSTCPAEHAKRGYIKQGGKMPTLFWEEEIETLPRAGLESIQLKRLQQLVGRMYKTVKPYRDKMEQAGVVPEDIKNLNDLQKLPFTVKDDLRDNYPFGLFTVPLEDIVRVHASSGTTGKPTVVGYTQKDIELWASIMARALTCAGAHKGDIVHNAYGYGLFTGGLGAHYGAERLGATVIPVSGGNSKRQITIMKDFGSTVLLSTPSYALNLAEAMESVDVNPASLSLRVGIFGAEPWSENMREEVEKKLNLKAVDIYGLSEVMGPGVAQECLETDRGMHVFEDHFLPEIIDPDTLEVLPPGEKGELVFTTLTKEAFPIIRYRTKDISRLIYDTCACGRTLVRMEKVTGRTDDMLIIRGVNVFPSQVEHVLMGIEGVEPHYQIVVDRQGSMDTMAVQVEVSAGLFSDEIRVLENLTKKIQVDIKDMLGVTCKVQLVEPKTIQRSQGKAQRVIDNRKI
jgi:phenylacetate-CoA ligase